MDDDDEVLNYVKNTGVNLIPNDKDYDNSIAVNGANDEEEEEVAEEDGDTASIVHPMPNKTFNTMKKLSTFYNPITTNYI